MPDLINLGNEMVRKVVYHQTSTMLLFPVQVVEQMNRFWMVAEL